mmetsp:Transcript_12655/g.25488  ORF Transcript_12655/g.25488 Transcript_12655/m.25488 type:complete len:197 (+) Transcript_12655:1825-2415(+)
MPYLQPRAAATAPTAPIATIGSSDDAAAAAAAAAAAPAAAAATAGSPQQPRNYKPYSGKVSSEYMVMGRLKPDLNSDDLMTKRANQERVKMFSRNLRVINREEQRQFDAAKAHADAPPASAPSAISKAQRAKEYASRVPKPRVVRGPDCEGERADEGGAAEEKVDDEELDALAVLERQHAENQRQAALIRAELGLG